MLFYGSVRMYTVVQIGFEELVYEVNEEDGTVRVYVSILDGALSSDVVVGIVTGDGTATGTYIYIYIPGTQL